MATLLAQVPLTATADVLLVASAQGRGPAGWRVSFRGTGWTGSVVLKANMAAPGQAQSLTSIAFITESTGATNTAGTAITADGAYIVQPDNCAYDLYAVYTHTAGSCVVTVQTQDGATPTGDLTAANLDGSGSQNTFGANVPYTGSYTFPGALAITGALTGVTQATFSTKLVSSTALATPSALAATAFNAFASTVSGAVLMGYGTTGDVTLKNRAGTTVAYVGPNTTKFWLAGDLAVTGAVTGVTTLAMNGALSGATTITSTSDVMAGAAAYLGFTGRAAVSSPSDGRLKLSNAAGTAFSDLFYGAQAGATTSHRIQKAIAAIVDNTDTAVFTVTVPNGAHSAMVRCILVGSLGAGGAVGANEASQSVAYDIAIARTAGVATVATASSVYGSANSAVAGAATITVVGSVSAMTGAVGDPQTFSIYVKVTKGGGASDNHTCVAIAEILNANATGISIA